jgi:hypothetical protein
MGRLTTCGFAVALLVFCACGKSDDATKGGKAGAAKSAGTDESAEDQQSHTFDVSAVYAPPWPPEKITAPALDATCESLGCEGGKGDFFSRCWCVGKGLQAPLAARWTPKYGKNLRAYDFEAINHSDRPTTWAEAHIYYYDADGKQLTIELDGSKEHNTNFNGNYFALDPGKSRQVPMGWPRQAHPKETARIEVVFNAWCFGKYDERGENKKDVLCVDAERPANERPLTP